jgi:hypothetical protein
MEYKPLRLVDKVEDIYKNVTTLDKYIQLKKDPESAFALDLIRRGICFLRIESSDGYRFYPSRFIGYQSNSYDAHVNINANSIDGRETNRAITKILGVKLVNNSEFDKQYEEYCRTIGFQAHEKGSYGVPRKYWNL